MGDRFGPEPTPAVFKGNVASIQGAVAHPRWLQKPDISGLIAATASTYTESAQVWKQRLGLRLGDKPMWEASGAASEAGLTGISLAPAGAPPPRPTGLTTGRAPGFSGALGRSAPSDSDSDDDVLTGAKAAPPAVPPLPATDAELSRDGVYGSNFATAVLTRWSEFREIADTENLTVTGRQATVFAIQNIAHQLQVATSSASGSKDPATVLASWVGFDFEREMATAEQRRVIDSVAETLPAVYGKDAETLARTMAARDAVKQRFMASAMHMAMGDKETARVASQVENETAAVPTAVHAGQLAFLALVTSAVAVHGTRVPWMHATVDDCRLQDVVPRLSGKRFTDFTLGDVWTCVTAVQGVWGHLPLHGGPRLELWCRGMCHVLGVLLTMTLSSELVDGGTGSMWKAGHVVAVRAGEPPVGSPAGTSPPLKFLPSLHCVTNLAAALVSMMRDVAGVAALTGRVSTSSQFDTWTRRVVKKAHERWDGLPVGDTVGASSTARRVLSQCTAGVNALCFLSSKADGMVPLQLVEWSADLFASLVTPMAVERYVHTHPGCLKTPSRVEASVLHDRWRPSEDILQEFVNELPGGSEAMATVTAVASLDYRASLDVVADAYVAGTAAGGGEDAAGLGDDDYVSTSRRWLAQQPRLGGLLLLRVLWSTLSTLAGEGVYNGNNSLEHACNLLPAAVADTGLFDSGAADPEEDVVHALDSRLPIWVVDVHAGWFIVVVQTGGLVRRTRHLQANEVTTLLLCLITTFKRPAADPDLLVVIKDAVTHVTGSVHPSRLVRAALALGKRRVPSGKKADGPEAPAGKDTAAPFKDRDVVSRRLDELLGDAAPGAAEMAATEWTGIKSNVPPGDVRLVMANLGFVPSVSLVRVEGPAHEEAGGGLSRRASEALGAIRAARLAAEASRREKEVEAIRRQGALLGHAAMQRAAGMEDGDDADDTEDILGRMLGVLEGRRPAVVTAADVDGTDTLQGFIAAEAARKALGPFETLYRGGGVPPKPGRVYQTAM